MSWDKFYGRLEAARNLFKDHFEEVTNIPCPRLYTTRYGESGTVTLHLTQEQADTGGNDLFDLLEKFEKQYVVPAGFDISWSLFKKNGEVRSRPKVYLYNIR